MAIYRTLYHSQVTVGTDGRMTIPKSMREKCGINEGDAMIVRVDENSQGVRQLVMWRKERDEED